MAEKKYYCYICDKELTKENTSDEHIILNAIGGRLHSSTLLCKDCNSSIGFKADAQLAEDLSFFTDMLGVKKTRQNDHNQIMNDEEGHEIIVEDGGSKLTLKRPYVSSDEKDGVRKVKMSVRSVKELEGFLSGMVKRGELTQSQSDEILSKAEVKKRDDTVLNKRISISTAAFPSIIKSVVNFYVEKTGDISRVKHLVPYIEGKGDCRDVLFLHQFKTLPYPETKGVVTHMIHIEGSRAVGLLYAMMEFFSIYVYVVVIDDKYDGKDVNYTYAYDTIAGQEVNRIFSLPLTLKELEDFSNQPYEQRVAYLPYIEKRANAVMAIWSEIQDEKELDSVINNAFAKFPEGCLIDEQKMASVIKDIMAFMERKISRSIKDN